MPNPEDTRRLVRWNREQKALPPSERVVWHQVLHLLERITLRGEELRERRRLAPRGELATWFASQLELVEQNTQAADGVSPLRGCTPSGLFAERVSGIQALVREAMRDVADAEIRQAAERLIQWLEAWKELSRHRRRAAALDEARRLLADLYLCLRALLLEMQSSETD